MKAAFIACVACGIAGCGASSGRGVADAGMNMDVAPSERPASFARREACGGTVAVVGNGLDGPFVPRYLYVQRCDGDCSALTITVATGPLSSDASLEFYLWPANDGTYTGARTVQVLVRGAGDANGMVLSGTVDITVADPPGLMTRLGAPPFGDVEGTFSINQDVVDLSGSFSSLVCDSALSV